MNILFIEDEKELAVTGVAQLELKGYKVFPAYDLAEAQAILDDPAHSIDFLITDHRLSDGMGIQFVIEMKESFPKCKCAVVSGCLTSTDVDNLVEHEIPYYHKPLLYGKVIDELRRMHGAQAPEHVEPEPESEPGSKPEIEVAAEVEAEAPKKKSGFKLWPFK